MSGPVLPEEPPSAPSPSDDDDGDDDDDDSKLFPPSPNPRLGIPPIDRIALASLGGLFVGVGLGFTHGSRTARLRFRAEHAHRMPATTAAWYLYHRSQNYHAFRAGLREGALMGALRVAPWTALAFGLEAAADRYRAGEEGGGKDMFNTLSASVTVAACFSLWNRFSYMATVRTAGHGLACGLLYGGAQDLLAWAKGSPVGYVEHLRRRLARPTG